MPAEDVIVVAVVDWENRDVPYMRVFASEEAADEDLEGLAAQLFTDLGVDPNDVPDRDDLPPDDRTLADAFNVSDEAYERGWEIVVNYEGVRR